MKKKSKIPDKLATVLIVVFVVCASVAQFALAVNSGNVTVDVPNPYGASTLSLNDATTVRTLFNSSTIEFGLGNLDSTYPSQTVEITAGQFPLSQSKSGFNVYAYLNIPAGTYLDYLCVVNFPASEWGSLIVNGGGTASLSNITPVQTITATPDTVQLIVNGVPVGDVFSYSDGFSFPTITIPVSSDVFNIGYRFTYTEAVSIEKSVGTTNRSYQLYFNITDNAIVTAIDKEQEDPYVPLLMANNSWLQSIFGNSNISNSWLEKIANSIGSLGGEGSALDRLATIFAQDDDLQLREDMNPVLREATDLFYNSEANPSTAVSTETVTTVGDTLSGMGSMFNSGYDATDAFQDIADNKDDYLAWFSQDTKSWLDTVPAAVADEDDSDPFNQWRVNQQYAEIAKRRGED